MTSTQITTMVLLIIGLAILLAFFYRFNFLGQIDRETCHESVILRGTLPTLVQDTIPLKCTPRKMCVTQKTFGKGECTEFGTDKRVDKVKVNSENNVAKLIADEMVDCWSMMGEGKLSLFSKTSSESFGFTGVYPTCVICSRIAFDKNNLNGVDLTQVDVAKYMRTYKVPGQEITYAEYFAQKKGDVSIEENLWVENLDNKNEINEFIDKNKGTIIDSAQIEEVKQTSDNKDKEMAIVFMQISSPEYKNVLKNTLTAGLSSLGLAFVYNKGSFFRTAVKVSTIPGKTSGIIGTVKFGAKVLNPIYKILGIATIITGIYQAVNIPIQRSVAAGYCGDVKFGSESGEGCSVVRTMNYDVEDLKQYCSVIEGLS